LGRYAAKLPDRPRHRFLQNTLCRNFRDHFVDVNKMVDLKEMVHKWSKWLIEETGRESIICLQDISGTSCVRKFMENEGGKEIHDQDD
jgi:hypothetical protein